MNDARTLKPFVLASLGLHAALLVTVALLPSPAPTPPTARVVEVTILPPKRPGAPATMA
ncbi:MAG: hypothetical protein HY321_14960, partial [Armatimonadetes bacterium]|nr:hypothetical protein [Armatimonadota bacterium]